MADLPIIDPDAIENLRALNPGDNDEFLREIIGIFLEDTPNRLTELTQSLADGDAGVFTRAAHSIKGSSSNVGAARLRAVAEKLEHTARKEGLGTVATTLTELNQEFLIAQTELQKHRGA